MPKNTPDDRRPTDASPLTVSSPQQLADAVKRAKPGDKIRIADGRYTGWRVALSCRGTAEKPIVFRPESVGGVTFTGDTAFTLTGSHIVMRGFAFDTCPLTSSLVTIHSAKNCRVTACRFLNSTEGKAPVVMVMGPAADNRLDHCDLIHTVGRCLQVRVNSEQAPVRTRIDHNRFQDVPPIGGNGRETVQIGQSQPNWGFVEPRTVVENNLFLRCNGEAEIISNKSSRNIYRNNLFKDCEGELVMRGASYCLIEGNRFEGCTGGIRLSGTHHTVIDNVLVGCRGTGIRLLYGMTRELGGHYQAVGNCLIANNTVVNAGRAGILIGDSRGKDWGEKGLQQLPPYDNRTVNNIIAGSSGMLLKADGAPDNTIANNLFHATGEAAIPDTGETPLHADPLFADPEAGDFRLRPESPATGAGIPLAPDAKTADIGASARPIEAGPSSGSERK